MQSVNGFRIIGSKANLVSEIASFITKCSGTKWNCFGDLFCGTAVVSQHFKKLGYQIIANDRLAFCCDFAKASLLINEEPKFTDLLETMQFKTKKIGKLLPTPYDYVLFYLNNISSVEGFIYSNYSPGGTKKTHFTRQYFTDSNAKKIDAIRQEIEDWYSDNLLTEGEKALLISDLMKATNKIANIAGTYGFYLKDWDRRAFNDLILHQSPIIRSDKKHCVFNEDANSLVEKINCDVLYFDPPYTWRHYGAYYHILETISRWDKPELFGMSGNRSWENSKSRYCFRDQANDALCELIERANSEHIFVSYNDEGLISHDDILHILSNRGNPEWKTISYRRYRSHKNSEARRRVKERLYYVKTK